MFDRRVLMLIGIVLSMCLLVFFGFTKNSAICLLACVPVVVVGLTWFWTAPVLHNPLLFVGLSLLFGITLRVPYLAYGNTTAVADALAVDQLSGVDELFPSIVITCVATAFIAFGFLRCGNVVFSLPNKGRKTGGTFGAGNREWDLNRLLFVVGTVLLFAAIAEIDLLRKTGAQLDVGNLSTLSAKRRVYDGYTSNSFGYQNWIAQGVPAAITLVCALGYLRTKDQRFFYVTVVMFLSVCAVAFVNSSRFTIVELLLGILVMQSTLGRLKKTQLIGAGCFAVFVMLLVLLLRSNRISTSRELLASVSMSRASDSVLASGNFVDPVNLSRIYKAVPDRLPYKMGATYIDWVYAPIPRSLWPGKPEISQGPEIIRLTGRERGGNAPGLVGEAIMNFGVFFVPFAALAYGFALRLFFNWLNLNLESERVQLIYCSLLTPATFRMLEGEMSMFVLVGAKIVLPCLICYFLVTKPSREWHAGVQRG